MKKHIYVIVSLLLILLLAGCSDNSTNQAFANTTQEATTAVPLTDDEIDSLYINADQFAGRTVTLTGQVFSVKESTEGYEVQIWCDVKNADRNTIIEIATNEKINQDDYIKITGIVVQEYKYENAYGGELSAPYIYTESFEKASYTDIVSPALKTVTPEDASITQHKCNITISKIEFAEDETRLYIKVTNNSSDTFTIYSFDCKIVQDGKQYEEETNYYADYPELQSEILSGVTSEGVIAFPAMEQKDLTIIMEAHSDNYRLDFNDYKFDITVE